MLVVLVVAWVSRPLLQVLLLLVMVMVALMCRRCGRVVLSAFTATHGGGGAGVGDDAAAFLPFFLLKHSTYSLALTLTVVTPCESIVCGKNSSRSRLYKEEGHPVLSPLPSPFYAHAMWCLSVHSFMFTHGLIIIKQAHKHVLLPPSLSSLPILFLVSQFPLTP